MMTICIICKKRCCLSRVPLEHSCSLRSWCYWSETLMIIITGKVYLLYYYSTCLDHAKVNPLGMIHTMFSVQNRYCDSISVGVNMAIIYCTVMTVINNFGLLSMATACTILLVSTSCITIYIYFGTYTFDTVKLHYYSLSPSTADSFIHLLQSEQHHACTYKMGTVN